MLWLTIGGGGQVKFCVLLMPSGPIKITGVDVAEGIKSDKAVEDEELVALLKQAAALLLYIM